jgi:hypothetical protein
MALLAMSAARPAGAISPSFLMVYGGSLKQPVIIKLEGGINSAFVWDSVFRKPTGEPGGKLQISDLAAETEWQSVLVDRDLLGPVRSIEAQGFRSQPARPAIPAHRLGACGDGDNAA